MHKLTTRELRDICVGFRRGILGNQPSAGMCYAVAAPLQAYLRVAAGIETELVEGDFGRSNHFWLKLKDGRIIDPTADQWTFYQQKHRKMPKVYIGPKPDWYKEIAEGADA